MDRFFLKDRLYLLKYRLKKNNYREGKNKYNFWGRLLKFIIFIVIIFTISFYYFDYKLKPTIVTLAQARAVIAANYAIDESINSEIVKKITYEDLVTLRKDNQNRITAVQSNVSKMNEIQSAVSTIVQKKVANLNSDLLRIPIGNAFESSIFAGWGPKINVKVIPVGEAITKFKTQFYAAGINQTRHVVSLDIMCKVNIVAPYVTSTTDISSTIVLADTIIVGSVPTTYLDVSEAETKQIDRVKGIAPNLATK